MPVSRLLWALQIPQRSQLQGEAEWLGVGPFSLVAQLNHKTAQALDLLFGRALTSQRR